MKGGMPDPMEAIIESALSGKFRFLDETETPERLDFYLPDHDVHIEVKRFHSERVSEQMSRAENVIAVQGKVAVEFMALLLSKA